MTTKTTINGIDATYPIAGKNNDSEGFRTNFNLIKTAMLDIDNTVTTLVARVGAISAQTVNVNAPYVTGTHVIAISDLTIGGTNVITAGGDNYSTIVTANGQSGSIGMMPAVFTVQSTSAQTDNPGDSTANKFGVTNAANIKIGATFALSSYHNGTTYTVTAVDTTLNLITMNPSATVPLFNVGDNITFTNPFFSGMDEAATKTYVDSKIVTVNNTLTNLNNATLAYVVPSGGIIMWSGSIASIPAGWKLCDGNNGTPNLTNKFIIGADADVTSVAKTSVEGSATQTGGSKNAVAVTHSHSLTAVAGTTNSVNLDHTHSYYTSNPAGTGSPSSTDTTPGEAANTIGSTTGAMSANANHSHTVSVTGNTDSAGESGTNKNLPPYYALAFIMKT